MDSTNTINLHTATILERLNLTEEESLRYVRIRCTIVLLLSSALFYRNIKIGIALLAFGLLYCLIYTNNLLDILVRYLPGRLLILKSVKGIYSYEDVENIHINSNYSNKNNCNRFCNCLSALVLIIMLSLTTLTGFIIQYYSKIVLINEVVDLISLSLTIYFIMMSLFQTHLEDLSQKIVGKILYKSFSIGLISLEDFKYTLLFNSRYFEELFDSEDIKYLVDSVELNKVYFIESCNELISYNILKRIINIGMLLSFVTLYTYKDLVFLPIFICIILYSIVHKKYSVNDLDVLLSKKIKFTGSVISNLPDTFISKL